MIVAETPQKLLTTRFDALESGDYSSVYASYHPEAPFRQNFSGEPDYLDFAQVQLAQVQVMSWQMLGRRTLAEGRVEQVLSMEIEMDCSRQWLYELALLIWTEDGWRYHSAQKMSAEDYSGVPEQIDFSHFDQATEKIRY